MIDRTPWALWSLRISTILYYLIMIACLAGVFFLPDDFEELSPLMLIIIAIFTLPFVIFLEIVIVHLKNNRFWAWVAGVAIGGLYTPSLFLPLGVFILIGLLSEGSRARFLNQSS